MAFPASSLASLEIREAGPPRLDQRILGLFGPNGALPIHLTEYAYERQHHAADPTLVRFANVFHHRMLLLFYRAWAMQQPTVSADRPGFDRIGNYLAAIGGFGMPLLRNRDAVDDVIKLSHASVFGRQIRDAESLSVLLNSYFNLPIAVEEWIGHWIAVPGSQRTRLSKPNGFATLGRDAVIGARVWDAQSRFRVVVGPVGLSDYLRFLPGGGSQIQLRDIVRLYVGTDLSWEMKLKLRKEEVPAPRTANRLSLGRTCWIGSQAKPADPDDYVWYEL